MKVYVATRFGAWRHAAAAHSALLAAGHVPTSLAWVGIAEELDGQCDAVPVGDPQRLKNARMDLRDLDRSDALIVLAPTDGGTGMWVELGYMLGLMRSDPSRQRSIVLVGPAPLERCVFCELVGDVVRTVAEAVAILSADDAGPVLPRHADDYNDPRIA